jgi:hypothetical protein
MSRILYLTDRFKVSQGYEPAFKKMLNLVGIARHEVITTDIYSLVDQPLVRKGNETIWKFNPERKDSITKAFLQRVNSIKPSLVVVSCPAILGFLSGWDSRLATLQKMRGGVYHLEGDRMVPRPTESSIPVIVTYPVTAIHQQIDSRIIANDDGEEDKQEPYRVPEGKTILQWDWQKVGRFYAGKQRKLPEFRYSICRTLDDCYAAREYLLSCVLISTDIETGNFPPQITCVGYTGLLANGACHSFVIPFYDEFAEGGTFWDSLDDHAIAWSVVRDINEAPIPKTMQNGSYDCSYFIRDGAPAKNYILDSMLLWYSLYMELPKSLDFISSVLLDNFQYWKDDIKGDKIDNGVTIRETSMERYWRYNALDCYNTLFNTLYLLQLMSKTEYMRVNYNDTLMRALSGLAMSMRGVRADFKRLEEHRVALEAERDEAIDKFRYLICDPEFNINSPAQKCSLLYDFFGLRERNARGRFVDMSKPLKGNNAPSAGAIPLKMAKYEHPLFKYIIESMEAAMVPDKQISNVCNIKMYTDRFRTSFGAVGTETTRFNSKKSAFWDGTNAQNIRGTYRDWMVADPDHIFLDVDYSQSDDVFVAYESEDPDKLDVINRGLDAHAVNGELFFGKTYDWIVAGKKAQDPMVVHPIYGIRQLSKKTSHGANFQMAAMTLYVTMGREAVVAAAELLGHADAGSWNQDRLVQMCGLLMLKYRKKYKRLNKNEWYGDIANELKKTGKIVNAFGITRRFLGDPNDNGTQREATAFLGQSGTAGNMNRVMYEIDHGYIPKNFRDGPNPDYGDEPRRMTWESHGFAFHLQVHDNFVAQLNLKHPLWRQAAHNLLYVMNRPVIIKGRAMRVGAEAALGLRWGKKMLDWDGDISSLDSIVNKLKEGY